jgi:hypothetical protein
LTFFCKLYSINFVNKKLINTFDQQPVLNLRYVIRRFELFIDPGIR